MRKPVRSCEPCGAVIHCSLSPHSSIAHFSAFYVSMWCAMDVFCVSLFTLTIFVCRVRSSCNFYCTFVTPYRFHSHSRYLISLYTVRFVPHPTFPLSCFTLHGLKTSFSILYWRMHCCSQRLSLKSIVLPKGDVQTSGMEILNMLPFLKSWKK